MMNMLKTILLRVWWSCLLLLTSDWRQWDDGQTVPPEEEQLEQGRVGARRQDATS